MFCFKHFTKEQFASQWKASRDKYYRLAYCYTKNEHDALEILSEATYKGYCHLHQLKKPEHFDTWMSRIIIFEAFRFLKQKKRWVSYEDYMDDRRTEDRARYSELYLAVLELSENYRIPFVLHYVEGYSVKEIGSILRLSESAVKVRLHRARKLMKERLKGEYGYETC